MLTKKETLGFWYFSNSFLLNLLSLTSCCPKHSSDIWEVNISQFLCLSTKSALYLTWTYTFSQQSKRSWKLALLFHNACFALSSEWLGCIWMRSWCTVAAFLCFTINFLFLQVGTGVTNTLIAARKAVDKTFAGEAEDLPILSTSAAYGVYMAVSSNLRYDSRHYYHNWNITILENFSFAKWYIIIIRQLENSLAWHASILKIKLIIYKTAKCYISMFVSLGNFSFTKWYIIITRWAENSLPRLHFKREHITNCYIVNLYLFMQ